MSIYEEIGGAAEEARKALDEAHRAEGDARQAFDRSKAARARILVAQSESRMPEASDLLLMEAYYRHTEIAALKGKRFVELSRLGDPLRQQTAARGDSSSKVKKESIEVMKAALRILTAITEKSAPSGSDLNELLSFAPDLTRLPPDELACEVIQRAMKRQVHLQRAMSGSL